MNAFEHIIQRVENNQTFLVLNLSLDIVNSVTGFDLQGYGFTRQSFHEDLHFRRLSPPSFHSSYLLFLLQLMLLYGRVYSWMTEAPLGLDWFFAVNGLFGWMKNWAQLGQAIGVQRIFINKLFSLFEKKKINTSKDLSYS